MNMRQRLAEPLAEAHNELIDVVHIFLSTTISESNLESSVAVRRPEHGGVSG
jgi:hypothetical protein